MNYKNDKKLCKWPPLSNQFVVTSYRYVCEHTHVCTHHLLFFKKYFMNLTRNYLNNIEYQKKKKMGEQNCPARGVGSSGRNVVCTVESEQRDFSDPHLPALMLSWYQTTWSPSSSPQLAGYKLLGQALRDVYHPYQHRVTLLWPRK